MNANLPPDPADLQKQSDEELVDGLIYYAAEGREFQQNPACVELRKAEVLRRLIDTRRQLKAKLEAVWQDGYNCGADNASSQ